MAPPRLYRLPHEQLVSLLACSKREGLSFEVAWARAMRPGRRMVLSTTRDAPEGCVRWPTDSSERVAWQAAINGLRDEFRRAYQGRPMTRREEAAAQVAALFESAGRRERERGMGPVSGVASAA